VAKEKEVVWFEEVGKGDVGLVGGKGANLGEMLQANIPVPPGFIVTAKAYFSFLKKAGIADKVISLLEGLDVNDSSTLQAVSAQIRELISNSPMPRSTAQQILGAYKEMGGGLVAVRSSATAEDLPEASFAGQQRTFLNIQGPEALLKAVQGCWASLFEFRAIFYREQQGFEHMKVGLAVPVQRMVQSEAAGVLFTLDPVTNEQDKIVIEGAYGLGETVVSGQVTPDLYVIDKKTLKILEKNVGRQEWKLIRNTGPDAQDEPNLRVDIPEKEREQQKLPDALIVELARIGRRIEEHYQFPQDIEWAIEDSTPYIVQSRPVTTIRGREARRAEEIKGTVLVTGIAASPGVASGPVRIISSSEEISNVRQGDVLVTAMTNPDYVIGMKRAVAIVTNEGGRTSHAAIVSRELGIPCVVGSKTATTVLSDGQVITVDGAEGKVYEGALAIEREEEFEILADVETKTRVYVNLAEPELADRVASRKVDGVGLLRAEFMVAQIGEHPNFMLAEGRGGEFTDRLARGLEMFAKAFHPRPVVYRTTDFKTNEYRNLKGGERYEEEEENPMLGYRGCSRYIRDLDAFRLETDAIKKVRERYKNLYVMLPFVRTVDELKRTKALLEAEGLVRSDNFKLWMMVEVPSNALLLDEFIDAGIDGISIGSNDLTQLVLGIDRDSPKLAEEFDERNEAVLKALEMVITTAVRRGITSSICGQAPSFYPDLTEKLVEWGITSVSVSPDVIEKTRHIIANVEAKLNR